MRVGREVEFVRTHKIYGDVAFQRGPKYRIALSPQRTLLGPVDQKNGGGSSRIRDNPQRRMVRPRLLNEANGERPIARMIDDHKGTAAGENQQRLAIPSTTR